MTSYFALDVNRMRCRLPTLRIKTIADCRPARLRQDRLLCHRVLYNLCEPGNKAPFLFLFDLVALGCFDGDRRLW